MSATDGELRRWQRREYTALGQLLDIADCEGLPAITWTVTPFGLNANCHQVKNADRRAAFGRWAATLGLKVWPERASRGVVHLHARGQFNHFPVAVMADLYDFDDVDGAGQ